METTERRWQRHVDDGRRFVSQGDYAQAEQSLLAAVKEALALGPADLRVASSLGILGKLKHRQGERDRAQAFLERALAVREEALGPDHYGVVQGLNDLAALHYAYGQLAEARTLYERALAIAEKQLGPEHADIALALYNLSRVYFKSGDHLRAEPLLTRLLALKERALGGEHTDVAAILTALSRVRSMAGRHDEAEGMARRALAIREKALPPDDPAIAISLELVAYFCAGRAKRMRSLADAERILGGGASGSGASDSAAVDASLDEQLDLLAAEERALRERARDIRARSGERREPTTLERSPETAVAESAHDPALLQAAPAAAEAEGAPDPAPLQAAPVPAVDVEQVVSLSGEVAGEPEAEEEPTLVHALFVAPEHSDATEPVPEELTPERPEEPEPQPQPERVEPAMRSTSAPSSAAPLRAFMQGRRGRWTIGAVVLALIAAGGAGFAMGRGARGPAATAVEALQESSRGSIDQLQAGSLQSASSGDAAAPTAAPPPPPHATAPAPRRRSRYAARRAAAERIPSQLQARRMTRAMERVGSKVMTGAKSKVDSIGRSMELPPPKFGNP